MLGLGKLPVGIGWSIFRHTDYHRVDVLSHWAAFKLGMVTVVLQNRASKKRV